MSALKHRTADCHRSVEAHIDLDRSTSGLAEYRSLLAAFYGLYAPLEDRLCQADWSSLSLTPICRTGRLKVDLQALDVTVSSLPTIQDLPPISSPSQLVGTLYVIEGAALGGRIIARTVWERLQIDATNGGSFFAGDAEQTGVRWKAFGKAAELAHVEISVAVEWAQLTFAAFETWLAKCQLRQDASHERVSK